MKKILVVVLIFIVLLGLAMLFKKSQEKIITESPVKPTELQTIAPSPTSAACQPLTLVSPKENEKVTTTFQVTAVVDNRTPGCTWTVFEAQAGTVQIFDKAGNAVGKSVLKTNENWMTSTPVTYTAEVTLNANAPHGSLSLVITEENPSGKPGKTVSQPLQY